MFTLYKNEKKNNAFILCKCGKVISVAFVIRGAGRIAIVIVGKNFFDFAKAKTEGFRKIKIVASMSYVYLILQ